LNGAPGVYSARYGGEGLDDQGRYLLLLENMKDVPSEKRSARFVSVLALALPGGDTLTFRGEVEGKIMFEARGESGFGYDPVFLHEEYGLSFAELSPDQKDSVSHRGRALKKLMEFLFG
jgi:XTP/dITP diphosphohydrolase